MHLRQPQSTNLLALTGILLALLIAALFAIADVAQLSELAACSVVVGGLTLAFFSFVRPQWSSFILGMLLVIAPCLGRGAVTAIVAAVLFFAIIRRRVPLKLTSGSAQLIIGWCFFLGLFGLCRTVIVLGSWEPYLSVFQSGGVAQLRQFLSVDISPLREAVRLVASAFVAWIFVGWMLTQERSDGAFQRFCRGLLVGQSFAIVYAVLQILRPELTSTLNYTPFWASQRRFSGTFSDPNAFGVIMTSLIPLSVYIQSQASFARGWRWLARFSAISWLGLAPFSGSRTFWLGLALWLGAMLLITISERRERPGRMRILQVGVFLTVAFAVLFWGILRGAGGENGLDDAPGITPFFRAAPSGVQRLFSAFDLTRVSETFESRIIYARLAKAVFLRSPIAGVGQGRFRVESEYMAHVRGIDLGMWWDNANNYYLQIVAEQGLVGLIALICVAVIVVGFILTLEQPFFRYWLIIFILLLVTGPHLQFEELLFLFGALLAGGALVERNVLGSESPSVSESQGVSELRGVSESRWSKRSLTLLIISLLLAVVLSPKPRVSRGFYAREAVDGELFAWSAKEFDLGFCGEAAADRVGMGQIQVRSLDPSLADRSVELMIRCLGGPETTTNPLSVLKLSDTAWHQIKLGEDCPLGLHGEVSRLFTPGRPGGGEGGDPRALGVQLRWNRGFCPV